jgi:TonB family protein
MNISNSTSGVFINSGCISAETLQRYALGTLDSEKQDLVEKHISACQLCSEAVKGLKNDPGLENLDSKLSLLERQIRARVLRDQKSILLKIKPSRSKILRYAAIAAGILLIGGVFSLLFFYNKLDNRALENNLSLSNSPKPILNPDSSFAKAESGNKKDESPPVLAPLKELPKKTENSIKRESNEMKTSTETSKHKTSESILLSDVSADSSIKSILDTKVTGLKITPQANAGLESKAAGESLSQPVVVEYATKSRKVSVETSAKVDNEEKGAFIVVDKMPMFNSKGIQEFEKYVTEHLIYPTTALNKKIEGTVYISFTVDTLGNVIKVYSLKESNEMLEKEAIRVVSSSPKWEPGSDKGVLVNVQLTIPVRFRIR